MKHRHLLHAASQARKEREEVMMNVDVIHCRGARCTVVKEVGCAMGTPHNVLRTVFWVATQRNATELDLTSGRGVCGRVTPVRHNKFMYSTQRCDRNKLHSLSGWVHAIAREHGWGQKCVQQPATSPAVLGSCFTLLVVDFSNRPVFSQISTWNGLGQAGCSSFLALGHQGVPIPSSRTCNALSGSIATTPYNQSSCPRRRWSPEETSILFSRWTRGFQIHEVHRPHVRIGVMNGHGSQASTERWMVLEATNTEASIWTDPCLLKIDRHSHQNPSIGTFYIRQSKMLTCMEAAIVAKKWSMRRFRGWQICACVWTLGCASNNSSDGRANWRYASNSRRDRRDCQKYHSGADFCTEPVYVPMSPKMSFRRVFLNGA